MPAAAPPSPGSKSAPPVAGPARTPASGCSSAAAASTAARHPSFTAAPTAPRQTGRCTAWSAPTRACSTEWAVRVTVSCRCCCWQGACREHCPDRDPWWGERLVPGRQPCSTKRYGGVGGSAGAAFDQGGPWCWSAGRDSALLPLRKTSGKAASGAAAAAADAELIRRWGRLLVVQDGQQAPASAQRWSQQMHELGVKKVCLGMCFAIRHPGGVDELSAFHSARVAFHSAPRLSAWLVALAL